MAGTNDRPATAAAAPRRISDHAPGSASLQAGLAGTVESKCMAVATSRLTRKRPPRPTVKPVGQHRDRVVNRPDSSLDLPLSRGCAGASLQTSADRSAAVKVDAVHQNQSQREGPAGDSRRARPGRSSGRQLPLQQLKSGAGKPGSCVGGHPIGWPCFDRPATVAAGSLDLRSD